MFTDRVLEGQVALVTGGGAGIGLAIATSLGQGTFGFLSAAGTP